MKSIIVVLVMAILTTSLLAAVENPDKPLKGKWDFQMKKTWEVENAGDDIIGEAQNIRASKDGRVYIADSKNCKIFIFSKDGKYISAFGPRGEGPGEIKAYGSGDQLFVVNNNIIFADQDRIHYFSLDGKYEKTVVIPPGLKPRAFVSEHAFISAPVAINPAAPKDKTAKIRLYNIKDQSKKIISEFRPFDRASATQVSGQAQITVTIIVPSITPLVFLDYKDSSICYGMSSSYKFDIVSLKGEEIRGFSIGSRKQKEVSQKFKDDLAKELIHTPKDIVKKIIDGLPGKASFFQGIQIDKNGMIYIFVSNPGDHPSQDIDIFSPDGKYLYSSEVRVEDGLLIKEGNIYFKDDYMLVPVEDEDGNIKVIKYSIKLPVM
jgi:hypothetical protein